MLPEHKALLAEAARPYVAAGASNRHFARSKLRFDPVFLGLLRLGLLPGRGTLLDLGCGRGLLLALLATARERFRDGRWPPDLPPPPLELSLHGIELDRAHAEAARRALDGRAQVTHGDLREARFPACTAAVVIDVLFYLDRHEQEQVLRDAAAALEPGGVLLMREADAASGPAFHVTRWSERVLELARGRARSRLVYRAAAEWKALLGSIGFTVTAEPMSAGTPFANVLFVCRKRDGAAPRAP
jgi:SAM-dependent methyltransferase